MTFLSPIRSITGEGFNADFRLAQARICQIKAIHLRKGMSQTDIPQQLYVSAGDGIHFAVLADPKCQGVQRNLLCELDKAASTCIKPLQSTHNKWCWARYMESNMMKCMSFHKLLVACQLTPCLESILADPQTVIPQTELDTLLGLAVIQWIEKNSRRPLLCFYHNGPNPPLMALLVQHGANPDAKAKIQPKYDGSIRELAHDKFAPNSEMIAVFNKIPKRSKQSKKPSKISRFLR